MVRAVRPALGLLVVEAPADLVHQDQVLPVVVAGQDDPAPAVVLVGTTIHPHFDLSGPAGTPTGDVALSVDGGSDIVQTLAGGSATSNLGTLDAGSDPTGASALPQSITDAVGASETGFSGLTMVQKGAKQKGGGPTVSK